MPENFTTTDQSAFSAGARQLMLAQGWEVQVIVIATSTNVLTDELSLASALTELLAAPLMNNGDLNHAATTLMTIERLIVKRNQGKPYSDLEAELGIEIYPNSASH